MTSRTLRNPVRYRKLARAGAISGPGYTYYDFLGVRLSKLEQGTPGEWTHVAALFVPHGTPVEISDPDIWYTAVDTHELQKWADRAGISYQEIHARFRYTLRTSGNPHLADLLTSENVARIAGRDHLRFTCEVLKSGARVINVYCYAGQT